MCPCVYIMASWQFETLYLGVTSNMAARAWQHREGLVDGFSKRYGTKVLVFFEMHETMESAIRREKQLKEWQRDWKIRLIEEHNPDWTDLYALTMD
ncbi:GIY-YIG nuclease family protein [Kaistia terrae]|uniref:GIY-YIG nuclease family protein n=1 Tax=Kaistia terrae TaxID=537017 RepID=A0ABW0Q6Z5_9HYPH|nr:GIY-YIG nuclease family protein [Kaistia terrae]MCX5578633.1 GIY-YIG nuclease family protein [Kaistia terrae]